MQRFLTECHYQPRPLGDFAAHFSNGSGTTEKLETGSFSTVSGSMCQRMHTVHPPQKHTRDWVGNLVPVKCPPKDSDFASFKMATGNSMEERQKPNWLFLYRIWISWYTSR